MATPSGSFTATIMPAVVELVDSEPTAATFGPGIGVGKESLSQRVEVVLLNGHGRPRH